MPSRRTRSDSPLRYRARVASCSGEAVNATSFTRPETVQIDTRRSAVCQDGNWSSYGCALSARKATGLPMARRYRTEPGLPRFPAFTLACWAACAPSPHLALIAQ